MDTVRESAGEPIVYNRWTGTAWQSIYLDAVRGKTSVQAQHDTREMTAVEWHGVTWRVCLADLAALVTATEVPDFILDGEGVSYTVIRSEGDQEWDYCTPDGSWARLRTEPMN